MPLGAMTIMRDRDGLARGPIARERFHDEYPRGKVPARLEGAGERPQPSLLWLTSIGGRRSHNFNDATRTGARRFFRCCFVCTEALGRTMADAESEVSEEFLPVDRQHLFATLRSH